VATGTLVLYATEVALVNATDGTISATTRELRVRVTASPFLNITLDGPATAQNGTPVDYTITARDIYGNVAQPTSNVSFALSSDLAGTFAPSPAVMLANTSTIQFTFTPTADGSHTVTATDGVVGTASLPLLVTSTPSPVVCTQSQSGGSSSADVFSVNLCATGVAPNNVAVNDFQLVVVGLQPSNGSNINGSITMTPPAGWTLLGTAAQGPVQSWVFFRRYQAGDTRTVSFGASSKNKWVVDMITYRSSASSTPTLLTATSTTNSVTAPAIQANATPAIVYYNVTSNNSTVRYNTPLGMTARTLNSVGGAANSMFGFDLFAAAGELVPAQTFATTGGTAVNSVALTVLFDR
jgi:hypothetical protein